MTEETLGERIKAEMMVDHANSLEKNFEIAKQIIKITRTGMVEVLNKEKLGGVEKIQVYLIGKRYAKEAGLVESEYVSSNEICNELSLKGGSVRPWIKILRDSGEIESNGGGIAIKFNYIESILKRVLRKNG